MHQPQLRTEKSSCPVEQHKSSQSLETNATLLQTTDMININVQKQQILLFILPSSHQLFKCAEKNLKNRTEAGNRMSVVVKCVKLRQAWEDHTVTCLHEALTQRQSPEQKLAISVCVQLSVRRTPAEREAIAIPTDLKTAARSNHLQKLSTEHRENVSEQPPRKAWHKIQDFSIGDASLGPKTKLTLELQWSYSMCEGA